MATTWALARHFPSHFALRLILPVVLLGSALPAWADTRLVVQLATGGDDLRGGNAAYISLVRTDGRVTFPETVGPQDVRSIRIRHDGNPRSGHPFDTYDNWNLSAIQVELVDAACRSTAHRLYVSAGDAGFREVRFTGALRQLELAVRATVPATWCTHIGAQRFAGDVNGDGQVDALCHDRNTGAKGVALRDGADLYRAWDDLTTHWCSHAGAKLHMGDFNGDRRADLICKDPGRIWFDAATRDGYFPGTGSSPLDTTWCSRPGETFSVGDQNGDRRVDLVCRSADGTYQVDWADSAGRYAGRTDISGRVPDFEITQILRSGAGYRVSIRNHGAEGIADSFWCSASRSPGPVSGGSLHIGPGRTEGHWISFPTDADEVTCGVGGRSLTGARELVISNNQRTRCFR
jgi:hypothetical protein